MDFQSAMETFAEAWVAASSKGAPLTDVSTQVIINLILKYFIHRQTMSYLETSFI